MVKALSENDLAPIEALLRDRPEGLTIRDLAGADASEAKRRSVHRRLKKLIELGRATISGQGKATRYTDTRVTKPSLPVLLHKEEAPLDAEGGLFVPVSDAGQIIQRLLAAPVSERMPTSYNRDFLTSYRPNETLFLSPKERKFLADAGATSVTQQPAGTYAKQILDRLLIDLSWNSSRLEGNRYSLLDTLLLVEEGKTAQGKTAQETQMILNHKEAIEFLVEDANEIGFNRHTILNLHALLSHNLLADPMASGRLRRRIVEIGGSTYAPLRDPNLIEECFHEILQKAGQIIDPFEQSFFLSIQIPYLQPFEDVNKRVSRLAANIPFIKGNLSPISFIDVPDTTYAQAMLAIYEYNATELARDMFIWAYERSARRYAAIRQSLGQPDPFRLRYREQLRTVVAEIIRATLGKGEATVAVSAFAQRAVEEEDRSRFAEVAETELLGLHEGNFARYRIRPSEFFAWKQVWETA